jgi:putative glutamine amidotransferase
MQALIWYSTSMQTDTKRPLIGITSGEIHNKIEAWSPVAYGQSQTYVNAVIAAGGTPLLLPLSIDRELLRQLGRMLDGLLLAGGNDIDPKLYGQEPAHATNDYSDLRDATEQILLEQALERRIPILGICRGMQLLNVHLGGTLDQDLTASHPGLDHDGSTKLKTLVDLSHTLTIQPDSKLAAIVGAEPLGTNAHHHQAVDSLGDGLVATAWAADGVIEAMESTTYPYAVCIQAHPESLTEVEPRWAQLFSSFVAATRTP